MARKFDGVLFDFDGTFADTGEGIFKCIRKALEEMGKPQLSDESLRTFIGPPLNESFKRECGMTDDETAQALDIYRKHYNAGDYKLLRVYDGMIELINTLKSAGIITAVASSKPQYFVIKILESLGVENIFDVVSGADGQYVDANKFRIIQNAMDKGGLKDKSKVLMVGDRRFDVIGSKTVGIKCAGVLFGYGSREELEQAGADYIVKDTVELKELILS